MNNKECIVCQNKIDGQKKIYCGNTCKQKHHYHRVKTQSNTYHSQTIRGYKRKLECIETKGGKCMICGYNKNVAALHFHHRNPSEKELRLDIRSFSNHNMDMLLKEVEKCDLLCSNCHTESHHEEYTIQNLQNIILNHKKTHAK